MERRHALQAAAVPGHTALIVSWVAQLVVAAILAQTLWFKLTYAPETRIIFGSLGGRPAATLTALAELTCVVLLLVPRTAVLGALAALGVIAGAIATHLFVIGIAVVDPATGQSDGGLLFGLALAVAALSAVVVVIRRRELAGWLRFFRVPVSALLVLAATTAAFAVDPVNTNWRGLALHGYDAVAYFTDGKPVEGSAEHAFRWNGATWRFANTEHRKLFEADPAKYAPQYGGYCAKAVSEGDTADVDPASWRIVDGKLYLNYSPKIQALWEEDIPGRIARGDAAWPELLAD